MLWFNGSLTRSRNRRRRSRANRPLLVLQLEDRTVPAVLVAAASQTLPASDRPVSPAAIVQPSPSPPVSVPDIPTQLIGTQLAGELGPFAGLTDSITAAQLLSSLVTSLSLVSPLPVTQQTIPLNPSVPFVTHDPSRGIGGPADRNVPVSFHQDSGCAEPDTGPAMPTPGQSSLEGFGTDKTGLLYWHIWSDADGVSHQTRRELNADDPKSNSLGASPERTDKSIGSRGQILVFVRPPGWVSEWHEADRPQWVMPIFGRWFAETTDGTRVEMGPGEASFDNDQHGARVAQGQVGHRSGTVGPLPAVVVAVQVE
jgi:hypothetical protein